MTKPITSVAVMMLYEEGLLRLTDPVSKYIPEFKGQKVYVGSGASGLIVREAEREMTIHDLLTHLSGLPVEPPFGEDDSESEKFKPLEKMYEAAHLDRLSGPLEVRVRKLAQLPLLFDPGTKFRYGGATDVLGYLVERVSGIRFDRFLEQKIFRPLGMHDTGFLVPQNKRDRVVSIYTPNPSGGIRRDSEPEELDIFDGQYFSAAGGLLSTVSDYFKFCQMLLNRGTYNNVRILSPASVQMMTQNHLPPDVKKDYPYGRGLGFGLGFYVVENVAETKTLQSRGAYGWGGAANTFFWIDPEKEIVGIIMTQFSPFQFYPLADEFKTLTYQALVD